MGQYSLNNNLITVGVIRALQPVLCTYTRMQVYIYVYSYARIRGALSIQKCHVFAGGILLFFIITIIVIIIIISTATGGRESIPKLNGGARPAAAVAVVSTSLGAACIFKTPFRFVWISHEVEPRNAHLLFASAAWSACLLFLYTGT